MSKKISVLLNDVQYDELCKKAYAKNLTITDFVISKLPISQEKTVTLEDVIGKISKLDPNTKFSIPGLFKKEEWEMFSKRSKLSIGKQFKKYVESTSNVVYSGKTSANLTEYMKK